MKINVNEETLQAWIDYMEIFEPMSPILNSLRRDRLKRVGIQKNEAIVGSANIDEIVEIGRNDQSHR